MCFRPSVDRAAEFLYVPAGDVLRAPRVPVHGDDDCGRTVGLDVAVQRIPEVGGLTLILGHLRIDQHEAVIGDERV